MKLSAPLRIAEVAELLGWTPKRTKRWLLLAHEASGGKLLDGGGARPYSVTLAALRRAYPDVFEPPPGLEARVEESESRQRELEMQVHQAVTLVGALRKQMKSPKGMLRVA